MKKSTYERIIEQQAERIADLESRNCDLARSVLEAKREADKPNATAWAALESMKTMAGRNRELRLQVADLTRGTFALRNPGDTTRLGIPGY